jgi:glycine hydroxymethyltransferase
MILARKVHGQRIDKAVMPGVQGGPLDQIIAAKAQALFEAQQPSFRQYQRQVIKNAKALALALQRGGLRLSSNGTDNHLLLVDLTTIGVTGSEAEQRLENIGLIVNKNVIPNDPRGPLDPSGIRLGTPGVTSRGLREAEMKTLADIILGMLTSPSAKEIRTYKKVITSLTKKFSIYPKQLW